MVSVNIFVDIKWYAKAPSDPTTQHFPRLNL